jgi:hypothetical protein
MDDDPGSLGILVNSHLAETLVQNALTGREGVEGEPNKSTLFDCSSQLAVDMQPDVVSKQRN